MADFGDGYYMPMDRGHAHDHGHHGFPGVSGKATSDVGISIGDLGTSMGLGPVPNVQTVKSRLHPGAKKLEFVFFGRGKGSAQGHTPGQYGFKQRQALVEIGRSNKVDFTTHSAVGIMGLAGMDQQGNFSKASKQDSLLELKRAVEFAADVGQGGPVVVHTGEFDRPIVDAEWNQQEGDPYKGKFTRYADEEGRTEYRVVDRRTGRLVQSAQKNRKVSRPVWNVATEGEEYVDFDGVTKKGEKGKKVYLDYEGNRVQPELRVPKFNKDDQKFEVVQLGWEDLVEEAKEMTTRAKEVWKDWKAGRISNKEFENSYWARFRDAKSVKDVNVRAEEAYIISTLETNAARDRGWALYYGGNFDDYIKKMKKFKKALAFYEQLEEATDEEEKWQLKREIGELRLPSGLVPPDSKFPSEILREQIKEVDRQMKYSRESSAAQWAQSEEAVEQIRNIESAETYAIKEAYDAYAQSAISAMRQSDALEKKGKLKKPIAVALENLFPEAYGSHPDELKSLVLGSRERMVELLKQQGMAEEAAKKKATAHITATFDTGHLNMWRKYWRGDPNKSIKENDKAFDKWMLDKVGELAKDKIIGHVHIDDNYGYHDDHLAPGEGNTPIKEMVKVLKKNGYKGELIVEPGADYYTDTGNGFASLAKTWKHFDLPVYGRGGLSGQGATWGNVQYGFFGHNQPAYFVFGAYSPSEEWTLWSGVPLE